MPDNPAMRPCLNQSCFPGLTVQEFVQFADRAGFHSVELRTLDQRESLQSMHEAFQALDLRVEAVNALMDWALPDDPDPRPRLKWLLEVAHTVDAPLIVCVAPIREGDLPPMERIVEVAAERLAELAGLADGTDIHLAFEQVGKSSSRPGAQGGIQRLADARAVTEVAGSCLLLVLDSYNLATADEDYDAIRSIPAERIGIAHLVDRDARTGARTLPGDGDLPLDDFVAALGQVGYGGALSVEIFPPAPVPQPAALARRALERVGEYIRRTAED